VYPFERFSTEAKQVLTLAQSEAERSHHSYIGTEHLLVGMLLMTEGLGMRVLAEIGVDLQAVRTRLATMRSEKHVLQQIIPTSRVKKVIELSFEEAQRTGAGEVTTGHMVVGLLLEGEGKAAQILKERGATLDDLRDLLAMLTEVVDDRIGEAPTAMDTAAAGRILAAAEWDASELGSRVVESDNLLRALASGDPFTAQVLKRLGVDVAEVRRVLTPPEDARALSEAVHEVRGEKKKALAARDYSRAATERRREKELTRELDERLRRWRETLE
jgi:ATP-dependent Clp protease ATP-binding subunit ClpC